MHSLLASTGLKNKLRKSLGSRFKYYRLFYTVLALVLLAGLLYFQIGMETIKLYQPSIPVFLIGMVLGLSGLSLMLVCIKKYFISLSGLLSLVKETVSHQLLITGIHRYIRHPLYLGTFTFLWGLFLTTPYLSLLIANSIITVYTLIGIRLEETKLINEFGENYKLYQKKVPKLIPSFKTHQKL
jgi:protein-S-isoprenylcysteine O-methyltransferase Ste14